MKPTRYLYRDQQRSACSPETLTAHSPELQSYMYYLFNYYYTIFCYSQTYNTPVEHIHISQTLSFYFRVFQQINISPVMPQLLKSDYFSSTTVDTSENININYSNVLPFHSANDDELDIFL